MESMSMMASSLDPERKQSGGLRTKQAGRGSCRGKKEAMGVLLREALRSICVNNQWSYAVFWKIGCQNSSLLIWEECYDETSPSGNENVQLLTNRMMLNNRIILVGEGLVGRAAFTGHHQWILADSFNRGGVHPPEVINEMLLQFSAGIQTVAVVPVVPHGVVQLGSSFPIMENLGFVNEVKGLILQLGCVPGALLSESYTTYEPPAADFIGVPVSGLIMPSQGHKILHSSAFFNSTSSSDHQTYEEASCNLVDEHLKQGGWQTPDAWLNQNLSCMSNVVQCEDSSSKRSDDLFDMLGLDDDRNRGWGMRTEQLTRELSDFGIIQETDHLLDAVVSGARSSSSTKQISSDETSESCKTTMTKVSNSSVTTTPSHSSPQGGLYNEKKPVGPPPSSSALYGSQISSWVEQAHSLKREGTPKVNETAKPAASNRKRLKPGENPRPRPKDRQMIQDRVKELREIIPNGAKCSIDALLERTIKHMLFLQNVSKHTDKVKQTEGESKIMKEEGGGATWAFEVGSKSLMCPIVVEDITPPRIFQVEMLCEQRGFFLEIADWIRSLGLTILKGVIESRVDKIWARFTVEASRDVTRMEIFLQLMNILEQTMKCGGGNSKAILDGIKATMPITNNTLPVTTGGCSM
ncbi:unnamed protein product [Brassica rapa]|nr:unnamed protein product [Brassica napus]CAG7902351.1 unnamed protein product [Brassica rapa]